MNQPLPLGPIGQISRSVRNVDEALVWYRDILGLSLLYAFPGMAFFDLGGTRLYLQEEADPGPQSILYFTVPDIEAAHAGLVARGVRFSDPPHLVHRHADGVEEWMAFFVDPEERPLALMMRRAGKG